MPRLGDDGRRAWQGLVLGIQNARTQLPYLPRVARLVWSAARWWTSAWAALLLLQGLLPLATVYMTRALVNALVGAVTPPVAQLAPTGPIIALVAALAAVALVSEVLRGLTGWVRTAQAELVRDHISALIHAKAARVDLAFYETPEHLDQLHRARADAATRPVALLESMGGLAQSTITLTAMIGVLAPFGVWLPVLLLAGTLPAFLVVLRSTQRQHAWRQRETRSERRAQYYDWLQTSQAAAAELRLFALSTHFGRAFQQLRARLRGERIELARGQALAEIGASGAALATTAGAVVWMAARAARGRATLGDVALLYQAFSHGQRLMRTLLENVGQLYANILFIENLFEFLAVDPTIADPRESVRAQRSLREGLRLERVTFRYPGTARAALADFSLVVPAGRITALVGPNGAGKSTVIKLLCRLYDPDEGAVLVDGTDLRALRIDELRACFTVLMQQPLQHQASAAQNIAFGALAADPSREAIEAAARAAGADVPIATLPQGYDTMLGKWFGAAELSVGEWQRVALARAFLREAPVLLLDEPTSAMDSWAEADWLERFRSLASGRTALIITHRFTTAMRADLIHVMDRGELVESGSHAELLAAGGPYSRSWHAQMATPAARRLAGGDVTRSR